MTENCKLRKAIFSAFYNISQRNFGILLILWCSFKLWWNFCWDQNLVYYASGQLSSLLSSTLTWLLFSFDWGMRVEKTLMQTPASQLSCNSCSRLNGTRESRVEKTLMQTLASQLSCNSCSRLNGTRELRKLSCKLSLLNSHQLSCNYCSRLNGAWELRKLSCKLSLLNSHHYSHVTLVLVWTGHESWENSHANSRFSTLM